MPVIILVTSLLSTVGSTSYGADPYGVPPPGGKHWTVTFEDDFTKDREIDKNKWNGGAGGTDWGNLDFHGKPGGAWMFAQTKDPGGQHYDGCTLSRTNGLEMRSPGAPSAALQTGGTTAGNAKFIQKFGYWEARFKIPHNTHDIVPHRAPERRQCWSRTVVGQFEKSGFLCDPGD